MLPKHLQILHLIPAFLLFLPAAISAQHSEAKVFEQFNIQRRLEPPTPAPVEDSGEWSNAELLDRINDNTSEELTAEAIRLLVQRGSAAMPEILARYESAEHHTTWYYHLTNIIIEINDSSRNDALARELLEYLENPAHPSPERPLLARMIRCLAAEQHQPAIEIMQKLIETPGVETIIRAEARIAINHLGKPMHRDDAAKRIAIAPKLQDKKPSIEQLHAHAVLAALLNHDLFTEENAVEITEREDEGPHGAKLKGFLSASNTPWTLEIGELTRLGIPVVYTIHHPIPETHAALAKQREEVLEITYHRLVE